MGDIEEAVERAWLLWFWLLESGREVAFRSGKPHWLRSWRRLEKVVGLNWLTWTEFRA